MFAILQLVFSDVFGGDCDVATVTELVTVTLEDGIDITATLTAYRPSICFVLALSDANDEFALDFSNQFIV